MARTEKAGALHFFCEAPCTLLIFTVVNRVQPCTRSEVKLTTNDLNCDKLPAEIDLADVIDEYEQRSNYIW